MTTRFFSDRKRPIHLGPYPQELLERSDVPPDLDAVPPMLPLDFRRPEAPDSLVNAMDEYQAMLDALRDGIPNPVRAECPDDPAERARHLKGFGYFNDASMVACCALPEAALLDVPIANPGVAVLADELKTRQTSTLAAGIDLIMAELKESMMAPPTPIKNHRHAILFVYEYPRDPRPDEPGYSWIAEAQQHRACLRATETAVVIGNYLRLLGFSARVHNRVAADVDLNRLTVAAGIASVESGRLVNPYLGERFGVAAVTTDFAIGHDRPLAPSAKQDRQRSHGWRWKLGVGFAKNALNQQLYRKRRFVDGPHPFEKLKRVERPSTYIDEENVARVPKRTDMFARAQFGDMGEKVQQGATGGLYVRKAPTAAAQRRALGAFVLIQNGEPAPAINPAARDPASNAEHIKAACYFLGADAVGLSACPDWAYYSHNAAGDPLQPYHPNAVSIIIDQGYETMEGASGDDWISVAQSMRAYLRFSLLGGVVARQIRNLGYSARAHTVLDGEVLQPPLLLLAGLGEVSRIGEVILNPFLGPRLKSGVVTTDMPFSHDRPIDFGLQQFCENCHKCARECPSGAITAGPKRMFNGYEIWKSDSQKCATYRITTEGGAMCGRCMKTCPWNLEGILAEKPFRALAMAFPQSAPLLEKLDDRLGNGGLNPLKKWWWDLEVGADNGYRPTARPVNRRDLQPHLKLRAADQTMAVYPAPLAPHPYPYPYPMDREKGIAAFEALLSPAEYQARRARGEDGDFIHRCRDAEESPVIRVEVIKVEVMSADITRYEFRALDGGDLPAWEAGAHLAVVVAPEYLRDYSMSGDPADRSVYQVGVLHEPAGRGGSALLRRIFEPGRKVFVSKPINHFALDESASRSFLMGGGIGVTPMLAMAHRLHALGRDFELHYSVKSRELAGFLDVLETAPWANRVRLHDSAAGTRARLDQIFAQYREGDHVYTCGPDAYMQAVIDAARAAGYPDEARHLEYFSVPETPDYVNHAFRLRLADSGREITVGAEQSPTVALADAGIAVVVKCSDGLCGTCKCELVDGAVEHRDFVLSNQQREQSMILCQSRAAEADGVVTIRLP